MTERDTRRDRASALNLHGLLAHWGEIASETWVTSTSCKFDPGMRVAAAAGNELRRR
jgi:hypothetical protein